MDKRRLGTAAAVNGTVLGVLLTAMNGWGGETVGFDDIKVGQAVEVEGRLAGTKTIRAREIEIKRSVKNQEMKGDIEAIDISKKTLRVLATPVATSAGAVILDEDDSPIEFSSLKVGRRVKVAGRLGDDGVFHAEKVKAKEMAPEVSLEGPVEKVDAERKTITVVGFTVMVVAVTSIDVE